MVGGLLSRKVECKIKRVSSHYLQRRTHTYMYIQWNLRTMDTLGVSHLSFAERLSLYTIAIQLSLNQYTKTKVLFKFGSLEKLYVEMISKNLFKLPLNV